MHAFQLKVREFLEMVGSPSGPARPELREAELRARLLLEECLEAAVGLVGHTRALELLAETELHQDPEPDLVAALDGLADVVVVVYGTAEAIGVDLEPYLDEVHRTNMLKSAAEVPGRHGKRGRKPPGWEGPRVRELLHLDHMRWLRSQEPPPAAGERPAPGPYSGT